MLLLSGLTTSSSVRENYSGFCVWGSCWVHFGLGLISLSLTVACSSTGYDAVNTGDLRFSIQGKGEYVPYHCGRRVVNG